MFHTTVVEGVSTSKGGNVEKYLNKDSYVSTKCVWQVKQGSGICSHDSPVFF